MFQSRKPGTSGFRADYAKRADFCEVFERDIQPLYLLAFLLTANHQEAEQSFIATLQEAFKEQAVFQEWARAWAKWCLIKNAIRIASPLSAPSSEGRNLWRTADAAPGSSEIDAVTRLVPLERFVFVMSVLERYSAWECSLLLGCSLKQVAQARMRALRRLPGAGALAQRPEDGRPPRTLQVTLSMNDVEPVPAA
jgi:DNA-directed RNA polymerase specialized sigma24 family protein